MRRDIKGLAQPEALGLGRGGRGKSTTLSELVWRAKAQGRDVIVADGALAHPDLTRLVSEGAKPVLLPRMPHIDAIRSSGVGFYGAAAGQAGLDPVEQFIAETWLADLEAAHVKAGVASWLPEPGPVHGRARPFQDHSQEAHQRDTVHAVRHDGRSKALVGKASSPLSAEAERELIQRVAEAAGEGAQHEVERLALRIGRRNAFRLCVAGMLLLGGGYWPGYSQCAAARVQVAAAWMHHR